MPNTPLTAPATPPPVVRLGSGTLPELASMLKCTGRSSVSALVEMSRTSTSRPVSGTMSFGSQERSSSRTSTPAIVKSSMLNSGRGDESAAAAGG